MLIPAIIVVFGLMCGLIVAQLFSLLSAMLCIFFSTLLLLPFRFLLRCLWTWRKKRQRAKETRNDVAEDVSPGKKRVYFYPVKKFSDLKEEERKKAIRKQGKSTITSAMLTKIRNGQCTMMRKKNEITFTKSKWSKWKEKRTKSMKIWYTYNETATAAALENALPPSFKTTQEEEEETVVNVMPKKDAVASAEKTADIVPARIHEMNNVKDPQNTQQPLYQETAAQDSAKKPQQGTNEEFYVLFEMHKKDVHIEDRDNETFPGQEKVSILITGSLEESVVLHIPLLFDILQLPLIVACFGFFFVTAQLDLIRTQRIQKALQKRFTICKFIKLFEIAKLDSHSFMPQFVSLFLFFRVTIISIILFAHLSHFGVYMYSLLSSSCL